MFKSKKNKRDISLFNAIKALIEEVNPDFKISTKQSKVKTIHLNKVK